MPSALRYEPHYTVDDYKSWQGEWELWFGTAVSMGPSPCGPHERCVMEFATAFRQQIRTRDCDCRVYANLDWIVSPDTVVRPDVMVVCRDQPEEHLESAPSIAVEVLSRATEEKDRVHKKALYEREGVRHYLIADLSQKIVTHFALHDGAFKEEITENEQLEHDGESCSFQLNVADMFL